MLPDPLIAVGEKLIRRLAGPYVSARSIVVPVNQNLAGLHFQRFTVLVLFSSHPSNIMNPETLA